VATTCHGPSQLSVLHFAVEPFTARVGARYWLRIAYRTCIRRPRWWGPRQNIAMRFGMEKLEWMDGPYLRGPVRWWGVTLGYLIYWLVLVLFWHSVRLWRTDTRTDISTTAKAVLCNASVHKKTYCRERDRGYVITGVVRIFCVRYWNKYNSYVSTILICGQNSNFLRFQGLYFHIAVPINVKFGMGSGAPLDTLCQILRLWV